MQIVSIQDRMEAWACLWSRLTGSKLSMHGRTASEGSLARKKSWVQKVPRCSCSTKTNWNTSTTSSSPSGQLNPCKQSPTKSTLKKFCKHFNMTFFAKNSSNKWLTQSLKNLTQRQQNVSYKACKHQLPDKALLQVFGLLIKCLEDVWKVCMLKREALTE